LFINKENGADVTKDFTSMAIQPAEFANDLLYLNHCKHVPHLWLIEQYEKYIPCLNLYNLSTHFNRHVEMIDIREVEELKAKYEPD
jgi:hypothetical protein